MVRDHERIERLRRAKSPVSHALADFLHAYSRCYERAVEKRERYKEEGVESVAVFRFERPEDMREFLAAIDKLVSPETPNGQ